MVKWLLVLIRTLPSAMQGQHDPALEILMLRQQLAVLRHRHPLSLDKDAPIGRHIQLPAEGKVVELKRVGGLHHEYVRRAE